MHGDAMNTKYLVSRIHFYLLNADGPQVISYVTDLEGNLDYFKRFVKLSKVPFVALTAEPILITIIHIRPRHRF